jgi:hypothetical protein
LEVNTWRTLAGSAVTKNCIPERGGPTNGKLSGLATTTTREVIHSCRL